MPNHRPLTPRQKALQRRRTQAKFNSGTDDVTNALEQASPMPQWQREIRNIDICRAELLELQNDIIQYINSRDSTFWSLDEDAQTEIRGWVSKNAELFNGIANLGSLTNLEYAALARSAEPGWVDHCIDVGDTVNAEIASRLDKIKNALGYPPPKQLEKLGFWQRLTGKAAPPKAPIQSSTEIQLAGLDAASRQELKSHRLRLFADAINDLSVARSLLKEPWFTDKLEEYARRRDETVQEVKNGQKKDTKPYGAIYTMVRGNSAIRAYMEQKIEEDASSPFSGLLEWYKNLPPPSRSR